MHEVVCLELDTFQVLRGQGQISDISRDGHARVIALDTFFFPKSKGVNLYLSVKPYYIYALK